MKRESRIACTCAVLDHAPAAVFCIRILHTEARRPALAEHMALSEK